MLVEVGGADTFLMDEKGRTPAIAAKEVANIDVINYLSTANSVANIFLKKFLAVKLQNFMEILIIIQV